VAHTMPNYVEKIRVPVRVSESARPAAMGFLCLSPVANWHEGPENLYDLLNSEVRVLPFHRQEDGAILLFTRMNISHVTVGPEVEPQFVRSRLIAVTKEEHVLVEMDDGIKLEGNLLVELPEHLNRASDYLNLPEDFFPLVTRQGAVFVNKTKVRVTRVFAKSPKPVPVP